MFGRISEKELVTKASTRMMYWFILQLLHDGIVSGLLNCFKILSMAKMSLDDFGLYSINLIVTQSPWAIEKCPLWLDISVGSKPKFYNKEEETAFGVLKDGKCQAILWRISMIISMRQIQLRGPHCSIKQQMMEQQSWDNMAKLWQKQQRPQKHLSQSRQQSRKGQQQRKMMQLKLQRRLHLLLQHQQTTLSSLRVHH